MAFSDAYAFVEQILTDDTGRSEMAIVDANSSSLFQRRIRRAVLAMHRIDFWLRDFVEQIYLFDSSAMIQMIDEAYLPRMRAIGYLRKWDSALASNYQANVTGSPKGSSFTELNPANVLDGYGYDKQNTMYRSGNIIKLNSSEAISKVLIGWFKDPLLDPITASDSWILKNYPDLIAAHAKRRIFKDIGKDEESRSSDEEYKEELLKLQTNNIKLAILSA
jgi:hypothetical protein